MLFRLDNLGTAAPLAAAVSMAIAGCGGSDRGSIDGTLVRTDGTPIVGARVMARSIDSGSTAYGTTDSSGYFEIKDGIAPGDYGVVILEDRGDPDRPRPPSIAAKYRDPEKSGLSLTVRAGESTTFDQKLDPR